MKMLKLLHNLPPDYWPVRFTEGLSDILGRLAFSSRLDPPLPVLDSDRLFGIMSASCQQLHSICDVYNRQWTHENMKQMYHAELWLNCSSWNSCSISIQREGCTFYDLFTQALQYSHWFRFNSFDLIQRRYREAIDSLHHLCSNIEPGTLDTQFLMTNAGMYRHYNIMWTVLFLLCLSVLVHVFGAVD